MNISSIVIKTRPDRLAEVRAALENAGLCEIHYSDGRGRLVATIEGDESADETAKLKAIARLPHVASADFAYTYVDDEKD